MTGKSFSLHPLEPNANEEWGHEIIADDNPTDSHFAWRGLSVSDDVKIQENYECGIDSSAGDPISPISSRNRTHSNQTDDLDAIVNATGSFTYQPPHDALCAPDKPASYVQIVVINDYDQYMRFGNLTEKHTEAIINLADSFYRRSPFNKCIRLALVGQETIRASTHLQRLVLTEI